MARAPKTDSRTATVSSNPAPTVLNKPHASSPRFDGQSSAKANSSKHIKTDRISKEDWAINDQVALAKIGRPYGLIGAMHVFPYSADAATLRRAKTVTIRGKSYDVKNLRAHGEAYVMMLDNVASPELAQTFTNAEIFVARDAFPPLPKGEFYWVDLIGLDCTNGERSFGKIVEVFEAGAHPILRVRDERNIESAAQDELIPFVDAIIRSVDLGAKRVDVDWEGLE